MSKHTPRPDTAKVSGNSPTTTNESKPRTAKEQAQFEKLEKIIEDNYDGSFKLAAALAQIRDAKLYRPEFKTFEEYCKQRWDYSRSYCTRLCDVDGVLSDLKDCKATTATPKNEAQARVFVDPSKEERIKLAEKVAEAADDKEVTAVFIAKQKRELFPDKFAKEPKKTTSTAPVIDVEATVEVLADKPKLKTIWCQTIKLGAVMLDDEREGVLGQLIEALQRDLKPWVEWEKNCLNKGA